MNTTKPLTTLVAFIIFNRSDTAKKVLNEIRKAKLKQLFVVANGAKNEKEASNTLLRE